jgi:hypothetical protein
LKRTWRDRRWGIDRSLMTDAVEKSFSTADQNFSRPLMRYLG